MARGAGLLGRDPDTAVFAAVFLLFPERLQGIATSIAGVLAVLAPTVGPIVGGWITQTYSWHWLFLINVVPGALSAVATVWLLPREKPALKDAHSLDWLSICALAIALAALEIALKEAPDRGWLSPYVCGLLVVSLVSGTGFVRRSLARAKPVVDLRTLMDPLFAVGCLLSFVLGIGLFGSVYMMPVFLAYVRGHDALQIGTIMLVTGIAQLLTAPLAVWLNGGWARASHDGGLCAVRLGPGAQRVSDTANRFRRNVLASDHSRRGDHVLPVAADTAGAWPPRTCRRA